METIIVRPHHELLKKYIEYFLFLDKADDNLVNYTTFPNNNLCLALYKHNKIDYIREPKANSCVVQAGGHEFSSRMWGRHSMPFSVNIRSQLDQVCIIFHPSALRAFSKENLFELQNSDRVFEDLFPSLNIFILEQLFELKNVHERAKFLERILLKQPIYNVPDKIQEALGFIGSAHNGEFEMGIGMLCKRLKISDTTLFRLFRTHLGQNPQQFIKTVRFRRALPFVLSQDKKLTEIGLEGHYYDQSHFIKDFRAFAGVSPRKLQEIVSVEEDKLAWIYQDIQSE